MSRVGNFSSSEIWKLTKLNRKGDDFGQIALTYIEEKMYEKRLGKALTPHTFAKPTAWGTFMEQMAYERIQEVTDKWELVSDDRLYHKEIEHWSGVPDLKAPGEVGDIKCPWTSKSFCEMYEIQGAEEMKKKKPEYYWQLVSNAILLGDINKASLFIYTPYEGQLNKVRQRGLVEGEDWLGYCDHLPSVILGNYYNDLKEIQIEISNEDKEFLTSQVQKASVLLSQIL